MDDIRHDDLVWRDATHVSQVLHSEASRSLANLFETVSNNCVKACVEGSADVIIATSVTISFALNTAEYLNIPVWNVKLAPDMPTRGNELNPISFFHPPFKRSLHQVWSVQVMECITSLHGIFIGHEWVLLQCVREWVNKRTSTVSEH